MIRRIITTAALFLLLGMPAAQADVMKQMVPDAGLVGEARF